MERTKFVQLRASKFNGRWLQAVELFLEMLAIGLLPDTSTMVAVTGLCSQLMDLALGKQKVLNRNMVMWSAAISNFAQSSHPHEALSLFSDYNIESGFVDSVIVLAVPGLNTGLVSQRRFILALLSAV
ncbi:hypothetical protein ACLB2K_015606 [Fragaria x ananassa]